MLPVASTGAGRRRMRSVARLCREPLLSDQSNKWDELQQVRLSCLEADLHNSGRKN